MSNISDLGEPDVEGGEMDIVINGKESESIKIRVESDFGTVEPLLEEIHNCNDCETTPRSEGHSRLCDDHLIEELSLVHIMRMQQSVAPDR